MLFIILIPPTFLGWKRLLLADGPRQTINALTLYSIYLAKKNDGSWYDVAKYFRGNSLSTSALTATTFFTFVIFVGSALLLIIAGICYIPLLCYIQGNLKVCRNGCLPITRILTSRNTQEYVCHKVDKRIAEVIKRRNKERLAKAAALAKKEAMGDFSHLKNKKGELIAQPLPQPTLPNLSVDDDYDDTSSMRTRGPPPSTYTQDYYDYKSEYKSEYTQDYPPMPAYNQPYAQPQGQKGAYYNQSITTFVEDDHQHPNTYDDDQGSTAHLALSAAPFGQQGSDRPGSVLPNPYSSYGSSGMNGSYVADPHDVYQGRAMPNGDFSRRSPQPQAEYPHQAQNGGMAGGGFGVDMQDYPSPTSDYSTSTSAGRLPQSQSFGALHAQSHGTDDGRGAYDYEGQGYAEQGYNGRGGNSGGGYVSHAM